MELHRKIGAVFGAFTLLALAWNLATPLNPDHWVNVIEHSCLVCLFLFSTTQKPFVGTFVQVLALFMASWVATSTGDIQPSAVLSFLAVLLTYLYGKLQTINYLVLSLVVFGHFAGTFLAAFISGLPVAVSLGHAFVWTMASLVSVWLVWVAMQQFSLRVLSNSIEINEINKQLMSERKDHGTGTP